MGRRDILAFFAVFIGSVSACFLGCNKTESPFGVYAPHGLDVPSLTPTPQTGSIEVYVSDTNIAIQGVSIVLMDPLGNTVATNTTQPVVGYAAFNPPTLTNGVWHAVVPAQSVSYVTSGPLTIDHTYWNSVLPIVVSGGGQYSATFTTGGNSVAISPVTATMDRVLPDYIPVTISYTENGNLDVPVSVSLSGYPILPGFSLTSNPSFVFGGGNNVAAVSIIKNTCYYQTIPLSLTAYDFSLKPMPTYGGTVVKDWSIPITFLVCKHANGGGAEIFEFEAAETTGNLSCGASIYSISYQMQAGADPPGGTIHGPIVVAGNTLSSSVTYTGASDPYLRAVLTIPNGQQLVCDIQAQYLSFDSFSSFGTSNW